MPTREGEKKHQSSEPEFRNLPPADCPVITELGLRVEQGQVGREKRKKLQLI